MSEEIIVKVNSYGPGRPLSLVFFDPVSGRKKAKSSGTTDWREAERLAGDLEKELRAGKYVLPSKMLWKDFRKLYESTARTKKGTKLSPKTLGAFRSAANHIERVLNLDKLVKLTTAALSDFQSRLREEGVKETTLGTICRHLRASLSWAVKHKKLATMPEMDVPAGGDARSRAVTPEEVDRMLTAAAKVRPHDAAAWVFYIKGLFHSGFRLEESLALSWDADAPIAIDLTGRHPAFRIYAEAQKSRKDGRLPMTDQFADLISGIPEGERQGRVFKLMGTNTGCPLSPQTVSRVMVRIGQRAGVVVGTEEKLRDGQVVTVKKFAGCHSLRRGFVSWWSRQPKVSLSVLKELARHRNISTTQKYYVTTDADTIGDIIRGIGNTSGNNEPKTAPEPANSPQWQ